MDTVTAGAGRRAALVPEPSPEQLRHRQRDEREGPSAADDLVVVLRLRGVLDPEALTAAWRDVLERHPVLRSVYPGPAAEAHVLPAVAVARVRRRPVAPGTGEDVVARVLAAPADLAGEGPARATLLRVAPEEHLLVLAVHRIAIDDRSVRPLLADLAEAYSARRAGRRPLFTAVPAFAAWAEGRGGPAVDPPREQCTGPVPPAGTRRIVVERSLVDDVAARLAALRAPAGEPPAALVTAAAAVAAVESAGRADAETRLDVLVPRRAPGFADSVGPFGTVVGLRATPAGTGTEVLDRVRTALAAAGRGGGPARTLVRHEPAGDPPAFDGLTVERLDPADPATAHERVVTLVEHPGAGGASLRLAVDATACDAAGAAALVRRLAATLQALLRAPASPGAAHGAARR